MFVCVFVFAERRMSWPELMAMARWGALLCWLFMYVSVSCRAQTLNNHFHFTHPLYNGTVPENAMGKVYVNTPVKMGIPLSDKSLKISFTVIAGDDSGIFHAESVAVEDFCFMRVRTKTGVYGRLNREHQQAYYLRIKATGSPIAGAELETFTDLNITLLDQNEFSPIFPSQPYSVQVPEDTPIHSSIATVRASDSDVGINGDIYYSLVQPSNLFAVHPTSGVVSLMRSLQFQPRLHTLEIRAEDRGLKSPTNQGSPLSNTRLEVNVVAVNYHAPIVTVQQLPALSEDAQVGSVFAVLTVTDPDVEVSGEIQNVAVVDNTALKVSSTSTASVFNVVVAAPLDREELPRGLNLTVIAVDKGQPAKTGTAHIAVVIQDVNDNSPKFEKSLYRTELLEVVPEHTPILFVKATDADEGLNGEVRYRLKSDDVAKQFSIDVISGLISTATTLDSEQQKQAILVVYAEDRASSGMRLTGETKVIIDIKDYNDNGPTFNLDRLKNVYVSENMPKGTPVVTVVASDSDSGDNSHISYSIHNTQPVPFEIDAFTGELTTTEQFDYETMRKQYNIIIRASDWGMPYKRWAQQNLVVNVQDKNDNSPEFEKTRCKGYLSREAPVGTAIVVLTAIDFDGGNIITYSISEGNADNCFSIEPSTGSVSVACDLTSYSGEWRDLTVVASDGEHVSVPATLNLKLVNSKRSQQTAVAEVSVTCQDTDVARRFQEQLTLSSRNNDNSGVEDSASSFANKAAESGPRFDDSLPSSVTVSESALVGSVVVKLSATDADDGYAGQLLYVISDGNVGGAFKVDTFSGDLQVFAPLDRETRDQYTLTVTVQDMGEGHRSSTKQLTVIVTDDNDNAPVFEHGVYEKSIFEDVQVNTTVLQVFATDSDIGVNGQVRYSLLNYADDFLVEADSSRVRVRSKLDRERISVYNIMVLAEDSGVRKLSTTATIVITLSDVNDNFPQFVPKTQTIRVREDLPVGAVITTLVASDIDDGDNGKVTYRLVDGGDNKFIIDPITGAVRIRESLDFETTQVYNLSIRAEDGGDPSLASMALLNIEVVDVNENFFPPEFPNFLERGSVAENAPVGTYVMSVRAVDKDDASSGSGRITYAIRDGSGLGRFTIDINGELT
jgi:protocadherin Fat 1/2/3